MKRLLSTIAILGISATMTMPVISCSDNSKDMDLGSIIKNQDLRGVINKDSNTIIAAVNKANPKLQIPSNELDVKNITDNSALITPSRGSIYTGSAVVTFEISDDLSKLVVNKSLGIVNSISNDNILASIKTFNPDVDLHNEDVTINIIPNHDGAIILGNSNTQYSSQVTVDFKFKQLLDQMPNKEIGPLANFEDHTIIDAFNKANNLDNIDAMKYEEAIVTKNSDENPSSAIISAKSDDRFLGQVEVIFAQIFDLTTRIADSNLGYIADPNPESVLGRLNRLYEGINFTTENTKVDFDSSQPNTVILTGIDGTKIAGNKTLNFTLQKNLSEVINNLNLGYLMDFNAGTIFEAVNKINNGNEDYISLSSDNIDLHDAKSNEAILTSKIDTAYKGEIKVNFSIYTRLYAIINPGSDLGNLDDNQPATVIEAVNEQKSTKLSLDFINVIIKMVDDKWQAILEAKPGNGYYGQTSVIFGVANSLE